MDPNSQSQIFTDKGSLDCTLPELLKKLGKKYKFVLFKNAAGELQLSNHSRKLRFRLKKNTGEILYTSHVSRVDKIIEQAESFLSGGETFQEHFVFFAIPKGLLFDFEESEKNEKLKREEAERFAQQERERIEKAIRRRQRNLMLSWVLAGTITVFLIAGFAYVKIFSHVVFAGELFRSEPTVRIIYSPELIKETFRASPIIGFMREAQAQNLSLSNKLYLLEQQITQTEKLESSERARLLNLTNADLIKEFPDETKTLAEVPPDVEAVVVKNVKSHPLLDTKELASALGISRSEALRLKWGLDTPDYTVVSPGVSHTDERANARSAAIQTIMTQYDDGLVKKNGNTDAALKLQADGLRELLTKNQKTKNDLQQQALDKIKSLGIVKPVNSFFQIRRKPCLLIFEQHGWIFEITGGQFEVELDAKSQSEYSFFDYLLQHNLGLH